MILNNKDLSVLDNPNIRIMIAIIQIEYIVEIMIVINESSK